MTNEEKIFIYDDWCERQRKNGFRLPEYSYSAYTDEVYQIWKKELQKCIHEPAKLITVMSNGIPFHARLVLQDDQYGLQAKTWDKKPIIEFYDARYVTDGNLGRPVARYYVADIISCDSGLCLNAECPESYEGGHCTYKICPSWNITPDAMELIILWVKFWCKCNRIKIS